MTGEQRLLEGSSAGGVFAERPHDGSGVAGDRGGSIESEPTLHNVAAEVPLPLGSSCKLLVELLLDGVPASHPYMSERLPLL